jgi:hypothetical protein
VTAGKGYTSQPFDFQSSPLTEAVAFSSTKMRRFSGLLPSNQEKRQETDDNHQKATKPH